MTYLLRLPRACLLVALLTGYVLLGWLVLCVTVFWYALDSETLGEAMARLEGDRGRRVGR